MELNPVAVGWWWPVSFPGRLVLIESNRLQYFKAWYIELNQVAVGWLVVACKFSGAAGSHRV